MQVFGSASVQGEGLPGGEHRGPPLQQHGGRKGAAQGHLLHRTQGHTYPTKDLLQSVKIGISGGTTFVSFTCNWLFNDYHIG